VHVQEIVGRACVCFDFGDDVGAPQEGLWQVEGRSETMLVVLLEKHNASESSTFFAVCLCCCVTRMRISSQRGKAGCPLRAM
jgi:hypothetical protein